jgi:hypothetical protein
MAANNADHRKPIEISGIQENSEGFCFLPNDATDIKAALKQAGVGQRRLISAKMHSAVEQSLNGTNVSLLDFIQILKALFKPRENFDNQSIAVLKEGKTIETLLGIDNIEGPLNINDKICVKKDTVNRKFFCLSNESILHINALLYKNDILEITDLLSKADVNERFLRRFLKGKLVLRDSFLKLLNLLADEGVIEKPQTSFQDLLSNATQEQEEGLTAARNTTENCMAPNETQSAAMAVVSLSGNGVTR